MNETSMPAPVRDKSRHNVLVLSACQALANSGSSLVLTVTALAGLSLAPDKAYATLPLALQFIGTMVSTMPMSLLMRHIGRRAGFTLGQVIGALAAGLAAWGIMQSSFVIFAIGSCLLGVHNGVFQYYRFAAVDTSTPAFRPRAVSYVLAGGVLAAFMGPRLATLTRESVEAALFAGSYLAVVGLCLIAVLVLQLLDIPQTQAEKETKGSGRPLAEIAAQPVFMVAVLAAAIGYACMSLVMTATPLAMDGHGFHFDDTATVIQWHVVAMFAPGFFTGNLIRRFGTVRIILAGTLMMLGCMVINLNGADFHHFWFALVLVGVGWNFMFVGGTSLLAESYAPAEKSKVQGVNDFVVFGLVTVASFSSGLLQNTYGWRMVNTAMAIPVLIVFAVALWFRINRRRAAAGTI